MPTELFPTVDIRKMNLHDGDIHGCQRISDSHTRVCVGRRVDDDSLIFSARVLNPRDQFPFQIRLADVHRHFQFAAELPQGRIDIPKRRRAINRFLTASEEIEIGTMQDQHTQHNWI